MCILQNITSLEHPLLYLSLILSFIVLSLVCIVFHLILHKSISNYVSVLFTICTVTIIFGIGLFEVNAIQFGMDQLLEESSTQLNQFIHWYFWFMHFEQQVVFCVLLVSILVAAFLNAHINSHMGLSADSSPGRVCVCAYLCVCMYVSVWASPDTGCL